MLNHVAYTMNDVVSVVTHHSGDVNETESSPDIDEEIIISAWISFSLVAFLLVLMVVILFSNGIVIGLYANDPQLRVPTNTFIIMLCIVDMIVGLNIPLMVVSTVRPDIWPESKWCAYKYAIVTLFIFISLCLQVAVAFDRLIAIAKPFHYIKIVSVRCSCLTSLALFVYCIGLFFVLPIVWSNQDSEYCFIWRTMKTMYKLAVAIPHYAVLFILLLFCYLKIFRVARKACHQRPPVLSIIPSPTGSIVTLETEMKAAKTLLVVVGLIFVTWFPYFLSFFLFHVFEETPTLIHFGTVVTHLPYLNSAWNPWIYAIRLPAFRSSFRRMMRRRSNVRPSSRSSSDVQTGDTVIIQHRHLQRGSCPA